MHKITRLLLLLCSLSLFSQSKIDSLKEELKTMDIDTLYIRKSIEIGVRYMRVDLDSALAYFSNAERFSMDLGERLFWAKAKYRKANVFRRNNDLYLAKSEYDTALSIFNEYGYSKGLASIHTELASLSVKQQKIEEAVELYLQALTHAKQAQDKNEEARIYNYLGTMYQRQKQFERAITNFELALSMVRELNFKPGISACLANLASVYTTLNKPDKAISYLRESLQIKEESGDELGASRVMGNLGNLFTMKGEYEISRKYYERSFELATAVGEPKTIVRAEYSLAKNAYDRKDFATSISRTKGIIERMKDYSDLSLSKDIYGLISKAYEEINNSELALLYSRKHNQLSDSLYNQNIAKVTSDLEAKYQNEQQLKEIALLGSERDLQTLQLKKRINERNAIIAFALIALVVAGLLYNQYTIKQSANTRLEQLDNLKSNFFANISHEFRTPLTLISGPIEQLARHPDKKLSKEDLGMIQRNTDRLLKLVNQLLDLSKLDAGNLKIETVDADLFGFLRAIASSFDSHAIERNITYNVSIPSKVLWASFDHDKLEKIIYNLLSNAFKFSSAGSEIDLAVNHGWQKLKIKIEDSGKGIRSDQLPHIFDRFYRAEKEIANIGTGIGLALTKELVELMGGKISAKSVFGKGTSFTVELPMKEILGKSNVPVKKGFKPKLKSALPALKTQETDLVGLPSVLLTEDNTDMRYYISNIMSTSFRVQQAENGAIGLKKALANPPDLIITDLMMPEMNGTQFCKLIKSNVITSHIPVIMLTAKSGTEHKIAGLETGADDYLTKPFEADELLVRTKNLIRQRRQLRERYSSLQTHIDPKEITVNSIDKNFLIRLHKLLEDNYMDSEFGVPQLHRSMAMSRAQFQRKIRALCNETPGTLLRNFRLKRAAQLLSQNADNISQIAYGVGFNSLSYFTKCFKDFYGMAPSSYHT